MSEDLPAEVAWRIVGVSVSGFYALRRRTPSRRSVRHAMLADVIRVVHAESRQTYGARRVHAELVLGRQITVARCTVELVMRRLGITGLPPGLRSPGSAPLARALSQDADSARSPRMPQPSADSSSVATVGYARPDSFSGATKPDVPGSNVSLRPCPNSAGTCRTDASSCAGS